MSGAKFSLPFRDGLLKRPGALTQRVFGSGDEFSALDEAQQLVRFDCILFALDLLIVDKTVVRDATLIYPGERFSAEQSSAQGLALRNHQAPRVDALLRAHPEYADALRRAFDATGLFENHINKVPDGWPVC